MIKTYARPRYCTEVEIEAHTRLPESTGCDPTHPLGLKPRVTTEIYYDEPVAKMQAGLTVAAEERLRNFSQWTF